MTIAHILPLRPFKITGLAACLFGFGSYLSAETPSYRAVKLGTPSTAFSQATDVNDSGDVVGRYQGAGLQDHAIMWLGPSLSAVINPPNTDCGLARKINNQRQLILECTNGQLLWQGGAYQVISHGSALSLNNWGDVVGAYRAPDGLAHAYVWSNGALTDLGLFGGFGSVAPAINDDRVIAVQYNGGGFENALLWINWIAYPVSNLGGFGIYPRGINRHQQVVGNSGVNQTTTGFLWSSGTVQNLAPMSDAFDINDDSQIVGLMTGFPVTTHAAVRIGDHVYDLNEITTGLTPGWILQVAEGINSHGQIAATAYSPSSGKYQAFRLDPSHVLDKTPPVITPQLTGIKGDKAWFQSAVNVSWTVTDPESE